MKKELNEAKKLCVFGIGHYLFPWKPVGGLGNTDEEVLFTNKCGPWCDDWVEGVCQFDPVKDLEAIKMDSENRS